MHDSLDNKQYLWAECLMNGNWSVYYRTIDGQYVGSYENTSATATPKFEFRQDLPENVRMDIGDQITSARSEDYADNKVVIEAVVGTNQMIMLKQLKPENIEILG